MKLISKFLLMVVLATQAMIVTNGQSFMLSAAKDHQIRPQQLRAAPSMPLLNESKDVVSFSWAVNHNQAIQAEHTFVAQSREYRQVVTARELSRGFEIVTDGAGAVVTINPVHAAVAGKAALDVLSAQISTPDGRVFQGSEAMDQLVDQAALQATGVPFSNGMVGFRLRESLGSGKFLIRVNNAGSDKSRYVAHVLDKKSTTVLSVSAAPQTFANNALHASGEFTSSRKVTVLRDASAFLVNPQGEKHTAKISTSGARFDVAATANAATEFGGGLWELHVSATDQFGIQRDVKTAFAVAHATARYDNTVQQRELDFDFGVETASAGRYEASGVIYATGANGLMPVAVAATAAWLEAGAGQLTLSFDQQLLKKSGLSAPYEVRHLTLKDQSRLSVLQSVERAFSIDQ